MNRTILNDQARRHLWTLWGKLRDVAKGKPFTWGPYEHGEAYSTASKTISAMLDDSVVYSDQEFRFDPLKTEEQKERDDWAAAKQDPGFRDKVPQHLVLDEGGVTYLRQLAGRLFEERTLTPEEGDRHSTWVDTIYGGGSVVVKDPEERIWFESFRYRPDEYDLVSREPGERVIFRWDEPGGIRLHVALELGQKVEIDQKTYYKSLGELPPICGPRMAEMVDGTTQHIDFGMGEGDNVRVEGYWAERGEPVPYTGDGQDLVGKTVLFGDTSFAYVVKEVYEELLLVEQENVITAQQRFDVSEVTHVISPTRYFAQMTKLRGSTGRGVTS